MQEEAEECTGLELAKSGSKPGSITQHVANLCCQSPSTSPELPDQALWGWHAGINSSEADKVKTMLN